MSDPTTQLAEVAKHAPDSLSWLIGAATLLSSTVAGAVAGTLRYGDRIKDAEKKVTDFETRLTKVETEAHTALDALASLRAEVRAESPGRAPMVSDQDLRRVSEGVVEQMVSGLKVELSFAREEIERLRDEANSRAKEGGEKWESLNRLLGRLEQASKTIIGGG